MKKFLVLVLMFVVLGIRRAQRVGANPSPASPSWAHFLAEAQR